MMAVGRVGRRLGREQEGSRGGFAVANRDNHYEAAFEAYLRSRRVPYVAVDEAKRSVLSDGASIKSLDFIVSSPGKETWLVDVDPNAPYPGDMDANWSHDGNWLAYARSGGALEPNSIRLYDVEERASHQVTSGFFSDGDKRLAAV